MIKTLIGFVLGVVASYYTYPYFGHHFHDMSQQINTNIFSGNSSANTSRQTMLLSEQNKMLVDNKLNVELMTAMSVIKTRNLSEHTSDFTVKLISKLIEKEPGIQAFVQSRLDDGISNKEALEIFERYYSIQG